MQRTETYFSVNILEILKLNPRHYYILRSTLKKKRKEMTLENFHKNSVEREVGGRYVRLSAK